MIIKELINNKIKQLTSEDLLKYGHEHGFILTNDQAKEIVHYYKNNEIDPFNAEERMRFFKQLGQITDHDTAKKAHQLFIEMIRKYNLEHLF